MRRVNLVQAGGAPRLHPGQGRDANAARLCSFHQGLKCLPLHRMEVETQRDHAAGFLEAALPEEAEDIGAVVPSAGLHADRVQVAQCAQEPGEHLAADALPRAPWMNEAVDPVLPRCLRVPRHAVVWTAPDSVGHDATASRMRPLVERRISRRRAATVCREAGKTTFRSATTAAASETA